MVAGKYVRAGSAASAAIVLILLLVFSSVCFADPAELDQHRRAIKEKGAKWAAEENSVSKLPFEHRKLRAGLIKPSGVSARQAELSYSTSAPVSLSAPLGNFDWRNFGGVNYVSPVKNQGNCGSCWAFAVTAALESQVFMGVSTIKDLSEQTLVSCSGAGSCSGGYVDGAANYIQNTGLPPESCFPYTAANTSCGSACLNWKNSTDGIIAWHWVATSAPTVDNIKNALYTYGPLVTTMDVYNDFFYYTSGIYSYTSGSYAGGHAITIVGYDDANRCFIVKNSWGTGWGESGYFRIAYSELTSVVRFGYYTIAYEGYEHLPVNQTPPAAPTALSATAASSSQVNLKWTDNATNESGYYVERCTGSGCTSFARIASLGAGATALANTGLSPSTTYNYRVQAFNGAGISGYSNTAGATTSQAPAPSPCSYSISPAGKTFPSSGGTGNINVLAGTTCSWAAKSDAVWIVVNANAISGTGGGAVNYSVSRNTTRIKRSGAITITGANGSVYRFIVTQNR